MYQVSRLGTGCKEPAEALVDLPFGMVSDDEIQAWSFGVWLQLSIEAKGEWPVAGWSHKRRRCWGKVRTVRQATRGERSQFMDSLGEAFIRARVQVANETENWRSLKFGILAPGPPELLRISECGGLMRVISLGPVKTPFHSRLRSPDTPFWVNRLSSG